jgi:hypothetical protein
MHTHTDLIFVYELTKRSLENIKHLEKSMKLFEKQIMRKKNSNKKRKTRKKYNI